MAVTMKDVRAALDPEEPDYKEAARLGRGALPHLEVLVSTDDTMLASKATFLASLIKDAKSAEIVEKAARSNDPAVRVAAATAASNLTAPAASAVLLELITDPDAGVRKVARKAVPGKPSAKLAEKLEALNTEPTPLGEGAAPPAHPPIVTGLMPGETGGDMLESTHSTMPGEKPSAMPGEQQKMPGER
jgi:HEAT repeat protein